MHEQRQAAAATGPVDIDFPTTSDAQRKVFESLRARLALAGGFVLNAAEDGSFIVTWRGLSRTLPDVDAVAAFAVQVGAPA